MKAALCCLVILLAAAALAAPTLAQLTVATDQATYTVGDAVTITIHNGGPGAAMFVSYPAYSLWLVESGECAYGCVGLPEVWWLQPGETILAGRDTGAVPDPPGHYRIDLAATSGDPGSILSTLYELTDPVARDAATWSGVKGLYR